MRSRRIFPTTSNSTSCPSRSRSSSWSPPSRRRWRRNSYSLIASSNAARPRESGDPALWLLDSRFRGNERSMLLLDASGQRQHDHDDQHDAEDAGGAIAPAAAVRPARDRADQKQNQDDEQNGAQHGLPLAVSRCGAFAPGASITLRGN